MDKNIIPVIDLFAGPGGLGEGFSSLQAEDGRRFRIVLSIEKDEVAHKTLTLRAFYRMFKSKESIPSEYYEFVSNDYSYEHYNRLLDSFYEGEKARDEACQLTLGQDNELIHKKILNIVSNLEENRDWVLIGGPPCQAYSLAGRVRNKGKKDYKPEDDHRHFLYKEYLNIIGKFHPSVFIMENVKGILSANVNGANIFHNILEDLKNPNDTFPSYDGRIAGYNLYSLVKNNEEDEESVPHDFIIESENFGVPQKRHRVIIIGVRKDIKHIPDILKAKEPVSVNKAISDLPKLRSGVSRVKDADVNDWINAIKEFPKLKKSDFQSPPVNFNVLIKEIDNVIANMNNKLEISSKRKNKTITVSRVFNPDWFYNPRLKKVCNHETRTHMKSDLHRYLFVSCFGKLNKRSPKLNEFPNNLLPEHENVRNSTISKFVDRFRVQIAGKPSTTITSHISKDGHYYIHPDPTQCRSLTVREAARLQTFPDDYFFCGPRTEQYRQVGNAVPPLLANQIAAIVIRLLVEDREDG